MPAVMGLHHLLSLAFKGTPLCKLLDVPFHAWGC